MVTPLDKKLARDLLGLSGQAITIALVVACGIAGYVSMQSACSSLQAAGDRFYEETRFADVFVHLERAPNEVAARVATLPGVAAVEPRVVDSVLLPLADMPEPAVGKVVTLPASGRPALSDIVLRAGRLPTPGRADEAVLLASFAREHGLDTGSTVPAVINGVLRDVRIVGLAMSPEYVFATTGEGIVDMRRLAVLWMDRDAIAPAFQLDGAFDDLVLRLQPGASDAAVIDRVDRLLAPYGGLGAVPRRKQPSAFMLAQELDQLRALATLVPAIFLGVAAYLLNVVLSRLVGLQRGQIATLKAVGYTNREVGVHFAKLVAAITLLGTALGIGLGAWLGRGMLGLYRPYFELPNMTYRLDLGVTATGVAVSLAAAAVGAYWTLRKVVRLPPAEAMQPEAPPTYRPTLVERLGLARALGGLGRMVMRELLRRPLRTVLSVLGLSLAVMGLVTSRFGYDAVDAFETALFDTSQRDDLAVTLRNPAPDSAARELRHVPGVLATETLRVAPVRVRFGARYRDVALIGHPAGAQLRRVFRWPPRQIAVPGQGVMLTTKLGEILGVHLGDDVVLEVLEGDRRVVRAPVVAFADEVFGLQVHASERTVHRLLGEGEGVTTVAMRVDPLLEDAVARRLSDMPNVASVSRRRTVRADFHARTGETLWIESLVLLAFSVVIAIGVVYNDARVALSVRARDLASLRVLGFTRREISTVLLGELATDVILAIVPGLLLGWLVLTRGMPRLVDAELMRYPVVASSKTFAIAVLVLFAAALATGLVVRRKLDRLDLVAVLKTRE
jgi:putative ABC transport system permease protein